MSILSTGFIFIDALRHSSATLFYFNRIDTIDIILILGGENRNRPWYENPEVNKEALAELYRSEGGRPFDGGFHASSKVYTDGTGSDVTGGSSGDRQVDPCDSNASVVSDKDFRKIAKLEVWMDPN
ncbi:hypothetical protein OAS46_02505 [Alphaproteobacteria bacterium]|nr:hypothetical protein [Alphaproteobacteria bacterium]MDC1156496.1 hypothetical protein [Alphaproteobacteria bacterium]